jgi:hypothetical protein
MPDQNTPEHCGLCGALRHLDAFLDYLINSGIMLPLMLAALALFASRKPVVPGA